MVACTRRVAPASCGTKATSLGTTRVGHAAWCRPSPHARDLRIGHLVPYASVYPLVTARAVARAFTYEVDESVGKGAIVSAPFGRQRVRGIVVSVDDFAPDGIDPVAIEGVV